MSEEEIRLIKGYFNDGYCCDLDELKEIANKMIDQLQQKENIIKGLDNTIENLEEVAEQKENIIKEVREYIENNKIYTNEKQETYALKNTWYGLELLEILGRENNDK